MKKILIICDVPDWAFDKNAQAIKKYSPEYLIDIAYMNSLKERKYNDYDIILNFCDHIPKLLNEIPSKKHILGIRSHLNFKYYQIPNLFQKAAIIAVANKNMVSSFAAFHPNVHVASGGVDTSIFVPKKINIHSPLVVGWAGTRYDMNLRGLSIINDACNKSGFIWKPALREDKWRTVKEMISYYQNDIDVYVDASLSAGRQNGLLEAGACGIPILATNVGITDQLITDNINGVIIDRSIDSICSGFQKVISNFRNFSSNIIEEIELNWSWKVQIKKFKFLFEEINAD